MSKITAFTPKEIQLIRLHVAYDKHAGPTISGLVLCSCGLLLHRSVYDNMLYPAFRSIWWQLPAGLASNRRLVRCHRRQQAICKGYETWKDYQCALAKLFGCDANRLTRERPS